jgi:hypothetical protein
VERDRGRLGANILLSAETFDMKIRGLHERIVVKRIEEQADVLVFLE